MTRSKSFLKSMTVWGAIIGFLPTLFEEFGVTIPPELIAEADRIVKTAISSADQANEAIGAILVIWGRYRAGGLSFVLAALQGGGLKRVIPYAALPLLLGLPLGACGFTPYGSAAKTAILEYGAKANDEGLDNAEGWICDGASVGSVKRRYGQSQEKADAYKALCKRDTDVDIFVLPGS